MVQDSQNELFATSLQRQRVLSASIPGLLTLKIQGTLVVHRKFVGNVRFNANIHVTKKKAKCKQSLHLYVNGN